MECFAVAAGMPRRVQAFPRPDPGSEHAMSEFGFKCFQKCGKNSSAVSPAPGPPFLKGLDFRGLTTTFLLSRPLITRTLPREVDWSFLDQIFFFSALFLQPLPGDFLFVKVTSPLFFSFPWAAPSASTNSCANTTAWSSSHERDCPTPPYPTPPHPNVQRSISNVMKPQQRDQVHMNVIAPPHHTPMCSVAAATSWSLKTL